MYARNVVPLAGGETSNAWSKKPAADKGERSARDRLLEGPDGSLVRRQTRQYCA